MGKLWSKVTLENELDSNLNNKYMIYTSLDNIDLKVKTSNYKKLGDKFIEWVTKTTDKLYNGSTESEKITKSILIKNNINFEEQVFFYDSCFSKSYFLDFYIPNMKLALEIDGGYHRLNKESDANRDKYFKSIGIKTIRIKNGDVNTSFVLRKLGIRNNNSNKNYIDKYKEYNIDVKSINGMINRFNKKYNRNVELIK